MERGGQKPVDLIALEQHFPHNLEPCYDRGFGDGLEVFIDRGENRRPVVLQVFLDTQIAHLSTSLTDITLRQAHIAVDEWNDVLELQGTTDDEWTRIAVHRDGTVILASLANKDSTTPLLELVNRVTGASPGAEPISISDEEEVTERIIYDIPEAAARVEMTAEAKEKPKSVTLTGRVGTEPRFRTTKNDKLVCYG
jgi:hypothetical protein